MVEIKEEFKDRLAKALEYADMTAAELSRKTKISESTLSQYKSGYARPKDDRLLIIANALGVRPSWLMGLDTEMTEEEFFAKKTVPTINATIDAKQSFGARMTQKEIRIVEAYRRADECIQSVVAKLLDVEEDHIMPIAARDNGASIEAIEEDADLI